MSQPTSLKNEGHTLRPLLEIENLTLRGSVLRGPNQITTTGSSLSCINGAQIIVSALADPAAINDGHLLLRGEAPKRLLGQHQAAYAPQEIPLPPQTRLAEALLLSARLVGLEREDVMSSLERCQIEGLKKKPLGELTRLQRRLSGLAHGLCGHPPLLILEDLFADLEDTEAAVVELILEEELAERSWIAAVDPQNPNARRLMMSSDEVLGAPGGRLLPPVPPEELRSTGYWVHLLGDSRPLLALLRQEGVQVSQCPSDSVLLIHEQKGVSIFQYARKTQVTILGLFPAALGASEKSHARSDA